MTDDPIISRKWALSAHGQRNIFIWGKQERSVHTIMKALLWALYLPDYPQMSVEVRIEDRYKPDVVAMPESRDIYAVLEEPRFWGESGQVGKDKISNLVRKYRNTHFAIAKWNTTLQPYLKIVNNALDGVERTAPFDLLAFPPDSLRRFINDEGQINVTHNDLEWVRVEA